VKIVQVVSGLGWTGGVQEYVSGLSRGLSDLGHEVVILTGGKPPPEGPDPHELANGLDIVFHPKVRIARRYLYPTGLRSSLRAYARWADVVHVHQPFFVGTWVAGATRVPLAATFHLHPEHVTGGSARRRRLQLSLLLRRIDLLVAVSKAEEQLIRSIRAPRRSGVVWPALAARPSIVTSDGSPSLVISVGRLSKTKGIDRALRAMSLLPGDVEVRVAGDGPDAARVAALCVELGMDPDEVLLGGSLSDAQVEALMDEANVFVSASRQEAFGIAPMKAIAHGCHAVLSDIPSHREIVTTLGADEHLLFDPDIDSAGLARLIASALHSQPPSPLVAARVPTWEDSARRAVDHYEMALEDLPRWRRQRPHLSPDSSSTSR
jgi:glycosyltransferase involved in cell wall biosynthesis